MFAQRVGCFYVFGRSDSTEVGGTVVALKSVDMVCLGAKVVEVPADIGEEQDDESVDVKVVRDKSSVQPSTELYLQIPPTSIRLFADR